MPAAHTAIPRVQSDALAVLAAPGGYPATLVQLARLALASASGGEIFLELGNRTERVNKRFFQSARHCLALWPHHFPKQVVVPVLRGVVEQPALRHSTCRIGAFDDVFQRLGFPFGASNQIIAINHIGVMMQIMMIFKGFSTHAKICQRIVRVR